MVVVELIRIERKSSSTKRALCTGIPFGSEGFGFELDKNGADNNIKYLVKIYPMLKTENIVDMQDLSLL